MLFEEYRIENCGKQYQILVWQLTGFYPPIFFIIAELWRAKPACGAPWVSKSTHPRKFGNHETVHRPPVRPHHRVTSVQSSHFLPSLGAQED